MTADTNAAMDPPAAAPAPEEDVTTTLYRAAIGPVSTDYYLPILSRFEAADRAGISWNSAAALSTLNWLVFRQLWGAALAYTGAVVALLLLVFGIGRLVFQFPDALVAALLLGFGLATFVLPGLFGNAVLYTDLRKRMSKALAAHSEVADACAELQRQASTRRRAIWLAAANLACVLLAGLAYQQFSRLSDLTVMPQGALDAGHVAVGRTVDLTAPASAAAAPALAVVSAPLAPASAASAAASAAAPASAAAAASAPLVPASAAAPAVAQAASAAIAAPIAAPVSAPVPAPMQPASSVAAKPAKASKAPKPVARLEPRAAPPDAAPIAPAVVGKANKADKTDKLYFINVGLFAVAANAERAHARLLEAQLPSVLKELKSTKGPQIRVRAGPFSSQKDARAAAEKIKALGLEAVIIQP